MTLMQDSPYDFCVYHSDKELKGLLGFKHRTFNSTDLLYFIEFIKSHYTNEHSLESAFTKWMDANDESIEPGLVGFYHYFFSLPDSQARTRKHVFQHI